MHRIIAYWPVLARVMMASLFIWDGILQLRNPGGTAKYFASVHVPAPGTSRLDLCRCSSSRRLGRNVWF